MTKDDLLERMNAMGATARTAAAAMAHAPTDRKNRALLSAAALIKKRAAGILEVNGREAAAAHTKNLSESFIDRMTLNDKRLQAIATSLEQIASFDDPVGEVIDHWARPNGLTIERVRTPIGVLGIIFESRPNVTVDAGALCLKSGNAAILRGGSECIETSRALFDCLRDGVRENGMPEDALQIVDTTDRRAVGAMLGGLNGNIDLIIPRGGKSLVARVQDEARVPVLGHLEGVCHVYVDAEADAKMAVEIAVNSKMRRPGVCGAAETLLLDEAVVDSVGAKVIDGLRNAGCVLRGDEKLRAHYPEIELAAEKDWRAEYLAPIMSVAAVKGVDDAITHIRKYSTGHTETIVTQNEKTAAKFLAEINSAIVMHNASTQFADGGEFGLGAEIGIATGSLHARGPVGLRELTTYKNLVRGAGQVRTL